MSASADQERATSEPHAYVSDIYSTGTEFVLCQAIAQLMEAVVGVLTESLIESIKSFYKLRKAYATLESILDMEQKFAQAGGGVKLMPEPDSEVSSNQIDAFIHSGTNLCFGIILLLISMVPPAFSMLLSIVGFRGDKQRGLKMLWQASRFPNLIGAIAALTLLGYYNRFVRFCDIKPDVTSEEDRELEGYPEERLTELLGNMRNRFPKSLIWLLEESSMKGANHDLKAALDLVLGSEQSPLKQVEALRVYERSFDALFLHRYELGSLSFIEVGRNHHLSSSSRVTADWTWKVC